MSFRNGLTALVASTAIGLGISGNARASSVTYDSTNSPIQTQAEMPVWEFVADMNTRRFGLGAAADSNGFVYAIGGKNESSVERYNPSTNSWEFIAPLSSVRQWFSAVNVDGKIYAVGGSDSTGQQIGTMEIYNPNNNTWTVSPHELNLPRNEFSLTKGIDNKIYAIGGSISITGETTATVEVFNTNNSALGWQLLPHSLNSSRKFLGSGTDKFGRIYAIRGLENNNTVERFDPSNPDLGWQFAPNLNIGGDLIGPSATSFDKNIFVLGNGKSSAVEVYNSNTDSWNIHSNSFSAIPYSAAAISRGYLYKFGGFVDEHRGIRETQRVLIPEPSSLAVIGAGLIGASVRRKKKDN